MALLVAMFVAGVATTLSVVSATESRITRNYRESKQTTYLAEAGIQHALWQLSNDPTNLAPLVAQGIEGQKYDALISHLGDSRYRILARGRSATSPGTGLEVDVALFPQAFNYAVATPDFNDQSLSAVIEGDVGEGNAPLVEIDLAAWAAMADWYISSSVDFNSDFYFEGILYVNGNLNLKGNFNWVEGTLIARDNIKIEPDHPLGYAHIAAALGMPALVAGNDIILGKIGKYCDISIRGAVICGHDLRIEAFNDVLVIGSCIANHKMEIKDKTPSPAITWNPAARLRPPPGISQAVGTSYSWVPLPNSREILTDLSGFEAL